MIFVKSKNRDEFMNYIVRVRFSARFSGDVKIVMLNQIYNLIFGEKINSQLFAAICLRQLGFGVFGFLVLANVTKPGLRS